MRRDKPFRVLFTNGQKAEIRGKPGHKKGGRHPFARNIADEDPDTIVIQRYEIIEIPADLPGRLVLSAEPESLEPGISWGKKLN